MGNHFGSKIRGRRRELGLTQGQLGERVGKSQVAVSEWERGVVHPSDLQGLARALEVSPEELVMAQVAGVLAADPVEAAILEQTRLPMDVRQSLVTVYKAVLHGYGPESELV
jgi:transcriptional regulator with XRE-family HTH domain